MKKLTTSVLAVVLSSSFAVVSAQKVQDTAKTQDIEGVVVTALGIKREKIFGYASQRLRQMLYLMVQRTQGILHPSYQVKLLVLM
jgi:hypothetical protein